MKLMPLVAGALLSTSACVHARSWDRDTLEAEARGVPDVIRVLSGRFERNPPLFYEMRLERVAHELKNTPQELELYDDAIVAADKLGRHSEALAWAEKKKRALHVLPANRPDVREHWYRLWANVGTARVHRWLHNGANRKQIDEVRQARDEIARAIHINPNAHFGREKYQLKALQWIVAPPPAKKVADGLPDILGLNTSSDPIFALSDGGLTHSQKLHERGYADAEKGLVGIITLGAGWQSIDVFNALRHVQSWRNNASVVYLLNLRLQELARSGRNSLHPQAPRGAALLRRFHTSQINDHMVMAGPDPGAERELDAVYKRLRAEADDWHARRTAFMLARLETGQHPDTDSGFWNNWDDGTPPPLSIPFWQRPFSPTTPREYSLIISNTALLLLSSLVGCVVLVRKRRNSRAL